MAVHESDREDLMREAVALVRRIELQRPAEADSTICGFRRDGSLSIYFGPDPVYHFDPAARLRRAFVEGLLYRTQGGTLARLTRQRSPHATTLLRHDLDEAELAEFLAAMRNRMQEFAVALETNTARRVAQVPDDDQLLPDLIAAIQRVLASPEPLAPRIKGKR